MLLYVTKLPFVDLYYFSFPPAVEESGFFPTTATKCANIGFLPAW